MKKFGIFYAEFHGVGASHNEGEEAKDDLWLFKKV